MDQDYTPFCGPPPLPGEVLSRWTLDSWLLAGLAIILALGVRSATDRRLFTLGWSIAALLFVSPLCAASMALFSARVGQHVLLVLVAAPILAAALPKARIPALPVAGAFAALFWFWHAPAPYAATLASDLVYWAMHLSLAGTAVLLFSTLFAAPERGIPAVALTGAQMTLFAVLLTLSPAPWHPWHTLTTLPYGLTAIADQQLAGALMWVGGGGVFTALVGWLAWRFLSASAEKTRTGRAA